ncbi:MAG TPA: SAM-dependent methyltransferase [Actinomycetes bacterium]|nr:SAM-dependent methyltransferase [Actinomycetes bacterium]
MADYLPWREAMAQALYGPGGFYRDPAGPAAHFRTSAHASPLFAAALVQLARRERLTTIVDIGAGRGELLAAIAAIDPGLHLVAVELTNRPDDLATAIEWRSDPPAGRTAALVVANEWLDNVPLDVVEVAADGRPRVVLVHPKTGEQVLGPEPAAADVRWLGRWWPLPGMPGYRAEIGHSRDEAWARLLRGLGPGSLAIAIDYGHALATRPAGGTLTGYRHGRQVVPIPDGSCDLTAHVAFDSLAVAARTVGAEPAQLRTQRAALTELGLSGSRPPPADAEADPRDYLSELAHAGEAAELLDPAGLGGFGWLAVRVPRWPA